MEKKTVEKSVEKIGENGKAVKIVVGGSRKRRSDTASGSKEVVKERRMGSTGFRAGARKMLTEEQDPSPQQLGVDEAAGEKMFDQDGSTAKGYYPNFAKSPLSDNFFEVKAVHSEKNLLKKVDGNDGTRRHFYMSVCRNCYSTLDAHKDNELVPHFRKCSQNPNLNSPDTAYISISEQEIRRKTIANNYWPIKQQRMAELG